MRSYDEFLDSMKETYRTLSGFDADDASDIGIRLKVLAHELCKLSAGVDYLMLQAFPDTAQGQHLDMHAQMRSLLRKQAVAARGTLRFSRENLSEDDTVIPAGTLCSTRAADELRFETTEECIIPAGGYHAVAAASAMQAGSLYNVAPAAVGVLVTPVPGIAAVTNPERFSGGEDAESDESLRSRLLESYLAVSNGANSAFYHSLAMQHEGIASVRVLPRERGRGSVDVVLSGYGSAPPQELIDAIQADMAAQREINVDVSVYAAQARPADITVQIGIDDAGDFAQVSALCDAAIRKAVNSTRVGEPLRLCELGDAVYSCKGVANYKIISPAEDVRPTAKQIVRLGALTLTRMEVV